eukprot:TRINITY_DN1150_c0_g1_i3.p2 TRINITY_DN1150_c0_g1~~TRINITY_DN1150_c0_g1_i3.p2  ORF type:complete len:161 (+),score=2.78 TRINITY_DN1150_c0_g1_i3:157-639(+)
MCIRDRYQRRVHGATQVNWNQGRVDDLTSRGPQLAQNFNNNEEYMNGGLLTHCCRGGTVNISLAVRAARQLVTSAVRLPLDTSCYDQPKRLKSHVKLDQSVYRITRGWSHVNPHSTYHSDGMRGSYLTLQGGARAAVLLAPSYQRSSNLVPLRSYPFPFL